jgi:hypothetical protein
MDTWMLIRLAMFQIEDRPMVSCFLLEVVMLVGIVRNNQQLSSTEAEYRGATIVTCGVVWLQKLL